MRAAAAEDRVLLSADTDFGEMLAVGRVIAPSVILFRRLGRRPDELARLLVNNLDAVRDELHSGALIVITADKMRVRRLPLG